MPLPAPPTAGAGSIDSRRLLGGDLRLKLKARWADGTTHIRLSPMELLERLAALVPKPRTNLTLYHGVFAANAKWRERLVPTPPDERAPCARRRPSEAGRATPGRS